jgi:hypothetical protein
VRSVSSAPAPTTYNISSKFGNEHRDFNRAKYSSMFQKPIAERPLSSKSSLPAPNQYDVRNCLFFNKFSMILIG